MKKFKVKVNGKAYEVEVEAINDSKVVIDDKAEEKNQIEDTESNNASSAEKLEGEKVLAPLPGTISVKVNKDDKVSRGDVIFVLEAMKMENEITAPADGTIGEIYVSTGDNVDTDDVLAVIV
ncbi:MAG: biotin/lipoyl-containing protein [Bacillota bacterium]